MVDLHAHFESGNNLFGMLLPDIYMRILSDISEGCVVVVVFITQYKISGLHNQLKIITHTKNYRFHSV